MKLGCPEHPKTQLMEFGLGIDKALACGLLELLWHFTAKYAPRGDVGKFSDEQIAAGAGWKGDAKRFVAVLLDCGWLDTGEDCRLVVHDWHEHATDACKKYLKRNNLTFASVHVRKKSGHDRTAGGQVAPTVAVAVTDTTPLPIPPVTGAVMTGQPSNGNGHGVPEDQREAYADAVWSEFLQVSGQRATRVMGPGEWDTLKRWMDAGYPLSLVVRGIRETGGKGSTLTYYAGPVHNAAESWRRGLSL